MSRNFPSRCISLAFKNTAWQCLSDPVRVGCESECCVAVAGKMMQINNEKVGGWDLAGHNEWCPEEDSNLHSVATART